MIALKWVPGMLSGTNTKLRKPGLHYFFYLYFCRLVSSLLYLVLRYIWPYRRAVILKNMGKAFPDKTPEQLDQLLKAYYKHFTQLLTEAFLISVVKEKDLGRLMNFGNVTMMEQLLKKNKDIVLMTTHFGNWEYLQALPLYLNCNVLAAYSPLSNTRLNSLLKQVREKQGVTLIPKGKWHQYSLRWESNRPTVFVVIADQRPAGSSKQHVEFLHQTTTVQSGGARLARLRNAAVVYLDVTKRATNAYQYRFELMTENVTDELACMQQYFDLLEKTITRQPAYWLWSHDRWKGKEG